jgi:protein-disulfide isomerase
MIRIRFAPLALAIFALAACNKSSDSTSPGSGAAKQAIAPPVGTKWTDRVDATPEGGVRMGNPDAPVKLVEYGSLSCPHCAKLAGESFAKLTGEYVASGRMSYEFRSTTIHPQFDVPLTLLARCVPLQAFFPMIEQIYRNFDAIQAPLSDPAVQQKANAAIQGPADQRLVGLSDALKYTEFFSARGVPTETAHACLRDGAKMKELDALAQKYSKDGIDSTPTLIVNGEKLSTTDWADLDKALKNAGVS